MDEHGCAKAALQALPDVARAAGVKGYVTFSQAQAEDELHRAAQRGARLIFRGEALYPAELNSLNDAPPMLWVTGNVNVLARPMVALVGARNASSLGGRMARSLAQELGQAGFVVASGLARGIDAAAHGAALEHGTVAVMAGGVDMVYPAENAALAQQILDHGGALISEQPMGLKPIARHFPVRNRIVSGISRAVVVVEAAVKSGSLITARTALDQGREVLAVPGHPLDARAGGCNLLIRDGAQLVRNAKDVLDALPPEETPTEPEDAQPEFPLPPPQRRGLRETAALHGQILQRLGPSPLAEDTLIRDLGAQPEQVMPVLTELEMDGQLDRQPGGVLSLRVGQD
jgi:DNA processing protein